MRSWLVAQHDLPIKIIPLFSDRPSCYLATPGENEKPRFDRPQHVATLIKEWVQYIVAPTFKSIVGA